MASSIHTRELVRLIAHKGQAKRNFVLKYWEFVQVMNIII